MLMPIEHIPQGVTELMISQGCNLSPILSNIYQNSLHNIFDSTCDPIVLDSNQCNSLSWTDDLILMSTTQTGLQNCLNKLHKYYYKWAISINPMKSTDMVMSKGRCKTHPNYLYLVRNYLLEIKLLILVSSERQI